VAISLTSFKVFFEFFLINLFLQKMIKLFAHRGFVENNMKQNSILSLKNAVTKGFKAIEFDIWWCDGEFLVKHDKPIDKEKFLLPRLQDYLCYKNELEYWIDFKNIDLANVDEALKKLKADLILPGSAYTEKDCIFINTEGRVQKTQKIVRSPGKSKNDASILSALINFVSKQKTVVNLKLLEIEHYNVVFNTFFTNCQTPVNGIFKNSIIISSKLNNFYLSDPISKASPTMAKCSKQLLSKDSLLI
jgi:glycerophosphoryl diester phosphodiesterase